MSWKARIVNRDYIVILKFILGQKHNILRDIKKVSLIEVWVSHGLEEFKIG